jgi:hypothetical protein
MLRTDGSGLWSNRVARVSVTALAVGDVLVADDGDAYGELRVTFDTATWPVMEFGLIYTDNLFLSDLRALLKQMNLPTDVEYSEQGMQGPDYVSLDAGNALVRAFAQKFS